MLRLNYKMDELCWMLGSLLHREIVLGKKDCW